MGGVGKLSVSDSFVLLASESGDSSKDTIVFIIGVLVEGCAGSLEDVSGVLGPLSPSQLFLGFIIGVIV